jgi:hypothetical protein
MRTRSACFAILLALSAGTAFTIVACSPDATAPVSTHATAEVALDRKVDDLRLRYGWIGEYHTDGLAYIYNELAKNGGKQKKDQQCKVAAKALKEFHKVARKGDVPFGIVDPSIASETCPADASSLRIRKAVIAGSPRMSMNELSPLAISYMDEVANAINSATSRSAFVSALHNIQYAAAVNLSLEEAGAVVAMASIAISSADYWEENLDAWLGLQGPATPYSRIGTASDISPFPLSPVSIGKPKWWDYPFIKGYRKMVAADVVGGARVLYTTWAAGPIGWDAACVAALWASATTAFALLF